MQVFDAGDVLKRVLDFIGLCLNLFQIRTEDADHERFAGAGEHLIDSFVEVGLDVAEESGMGLNDFFDLSTVSS